MQKLDLPPCSLRLRPQEGKVQAYDVIRKKFVVLSPEEWVRQHVVHYLISHKKYPRLHISVEKMLKVNGLSKRYDVVVFDRNGDILLIVECKAPGVKISQETFDQIARYNMTLNSQLLLVTNGLQHYCCKINAELERYDFLPELPSYESL
jgi:type I site-specific restriction-modification system R (restriction) subunit